MCSAFNSIWCAAFVAAIGCYSVGFAGELLPCLRSSRCRRHASCRRCCIAAATRGAITSVAGVAVTCGAADAWPDHAARAIFCGLLVGGLANFTRADWRRMAMTAITFGACVAIEALQSALKRLGKGPQDE